MSGLECLPMCFVCQDELGKAKSAWDQHKKREKGSTTL